MPKPRKILISLEATPYYHCVSRCVRRAFLCGYDKFSEKPYDHRRQWIEERLAVLEEAFAIDVCAFAVMSNHTHVVLHIDAEAARAWSVREIIDRWLTLRKGPLLIQRYVTGEVLTDPERDQVSAIAETWRERLMNISWFMAALNEFIARRANKEDGCTGRFWEGRFRSQALLDEKALLACMAYVDLNPIRAKMADTPESSDHTSIQQRISRALNRPIPKEKQHPVPLLPFIGDLHAGMPKGIPFHYDDYLQLVEWTGRAMVAGKRGSIPDDLPPILQRLQFDAKQWLFLTQHFESRFKGLVGMAAMVKAAANRIGFKRTPGLAVCLANLN